MAGTLTVMATIFGVLFYSYFYLRVYSPEWPQGQLPVPDLLKPGLTYGVLLGSGGLLFFGQQFQKGLLPILSLLGCTVMGIIAGALILMESVQSGFAPQLNAYASLFHTIIWHMTALIFFGLAMLVSSLLHLIRNGDGAVSGTLILHRQITALAWYFTLVIAALVFATLYLSPRLF
jgi:hypothetical protein